MTGQRNRGHNHMYATERLATDGYPEIELSARLVGDKLELAGTAVVYEGNVLITFVSSTGKRTVTNTQASMGGPWRGDWSASIDIPADTISVIVGQEEMEEGVGDEETKGQIEIPLLDLHQSDRTV